MVPSPANDQCVGEPDLPTASRTQSPPWYSTRYMFVASNAGRRSPPNVAVLAPVAGETIKAPGAWLPPSRYRLPPFSTEVAPPPPSHPCVCVHRFVPSRLKPYDRSQT